MRYLSLLLLAISILCATGGNTLYAQEQEKILIISDEVGEVIDAEERERFGLWPDIEGFTSATFLQLPDGTSVAEVVYERDGEEHKARTPQSTVSLESLRIYIERVSREEIVPLSSEKAHKKEDAQYTPYTKGTLVIISDEIGEYLDSEERITYNLFTNLPDFARASFYVRAESGFLIEIETEKGMLVSVVRDTAMASILNDYIERYQEICINRESFEKKWSIIGYDDQGIPITTDEGMHFQKKGSCCTAGATLGCCGVGFIAGAAIYVVRALDDPDKESEGFPLIIGPLIGAVAGYVIGSTHDAKAEKEEIIKHVSALRTPG